MQKGDQLDGRVRKLVVCVAKTPKAACFFLFVGFLVMLIIVQQITAG